MRRRLAGASLVLLVPLALIGAVCAVGIGILGYRLISTSGTVPRLTSAMLNAAEDTNVATCTSVNPYAAATGTFVVTGNAFQQVSDYAIPNADTEITALSVEAWVNSRTTITTASRAFSVEFSGSGGSSETFNGFRAPFATNVGTAHRVAAWDVADTGYDAAGRGRIHVRGGGTTSVWSANPDHRIRVVVHVTGTTRTAVPCT